MTTHQYQSLLQLFLQEIPQRLTSRPRRTGWKMARLFNFCQQIRVFPVWHNHRWKSFSSTNSETARLSRTKVIQVGDCNINTVKVGHGPHVVFILPGLLGCMTLQVEPLINGLDTNEFTIYSWDQPGYAGSQPPSRSFTHNPAAYDSQLLISTMKEFGHEEYSLLGWSAGGMTALLTAINHPRLIRKLVVWGAWARVREEDAKKFQWFRNTENLGGRMKDALVDYYGQEYFEHEWDRWMQSFIRIHTHDGGDFCASRLHQIHCPTLIIHGEDDGLISPDHGEFLHQNIPNSKLLIWRKGKHNVHLRYPLEFNRIVQDFLTE